MVDAWEAGMYHAFEKIDKVLKFNSGISWVTLGISLVSLTASLVSLSISLSFNQ